MANLRLDEDGLLDVAVHDCDLADLQPHFGAFQRTDRRPKLFKKLEEYVDALRGAGIRGSVIIDGSFIMSQVDEPEDIDVVLVLAEDWDLEADLQPYQYNLVSKKAVRRNYPIEVYPAIAGRESEIKWTEFFLQVNVKWYEPFGFTAGKQKGLARISI